MSTRQAAKKELEKRTTVELESLYRKTWPATQMSIEFYKDEQDYRRVLTNALADGVYFGKVTL